MRSYSANRTIVAGDSYIYILGEVREISPLHVSPISTSPWISIRKNFPE